MGAKELNTDINRSSGEQITEIITCDPVPRELLISIANSIHSTKAWELLHLLLLLLCGLAVDL